GLAGAVLLQGLATLKTPWAIFRGSLCYWFFAVPTFSLGTSLTFRHLKDPEREFGPIRFWGTAGWVASNWALTAWFIVSQWLWNSPPDFTDAFRWSSYLSIFQWLYALTLPPTPPTKRIANNETPGLLARLKTLVDAPLLAFQLLRRRNLAIYVGCVL